MTNVNSFDLQVIFNSAIMSLIVVAAYSIIRKILWNAKQNNLLQGYGSSAKEQEKDILTPVFIVVAVFAINFFIYYGI